ncbi:MAG: response regulator transcription factor [Lachnospiraceae bacterium]|nr:response regulator transcription factor [Lachnospiraceae bacterium]
MATILMIDDDAEVLEINRKFLCGEGFQVYIESDPLQGIEQAKKTNPDCILLDIMMPGLDGYQVCESLRRFTSAPIIFLTGKDAEDDKITGLTLGADDYIVKPYSLRELKVRIDVLLRRMQRIQPLQDSHLLTVQNLSIDQLTHKAFYKGTEIVLANREYEVLLYFATHPNQDITFEELGNALFGSYQEADRRSIMVNVSRLRKKMNIDFELEKMIETVWSKGYKFIVKNS